MKSDQIQDVIDDIRTIRKDQESARRVSGPVKNAYEQQAAMRASAFIADNYALITDALRKYQETSSQDHVVLPYPATKEMLVAFTHIWNGGDHFSQKNHKLTNRQFERASYAYRHMCGVALDQHGNGVFGKAMSSAKPIPNRKDGIVKVVRSKHSNNAPHLVYVYCDTPEAASTIETMLSQFSNKKFTKEKPFTVVTCDSPASVAEALSVAKTNTESKHRPETVSMVTKEMISYCNNLGPNGSFDVGTLKDFASRIDNALDRLLRQRYEAYMHLTQQIVQLETALKHARAESGPVDNAKSHKCTPECVCNDRMYQRRIASMQARIDSLMLEYCPEEMTPKQLATWELHQQPVPGTHPKDKK